MARAERKIQQLESGFTFEARRRQLVLGMRNHILKANPRVSLAEAYRYAELALAASEKYPAVDPLLLLAIGIVESGYDPQARSRADARGLYQIWPSTGRLLARALGWTLRRLAPLRPREEHAGGGALPGRAVLDLQGPADGPGRVQRRAPQRGLPARGSGGARRETRNYVPRVLELHERLKQEFAAGTALALQTGEQADAERRGKTLGAP